MRPRNLPPVLLLLRLEQVALLMPEAPAGLSDWQAQLRQCGMMPGQSQSD